MSDVLTRDEYAGIAAETPFPSNAWINGKYTAARSGETFETVNPATGEVLAQMASCGAEDVDYAAKKARQAFEAARRAIIRCGAQGFDLPREKYDHWRDIEMVFNPEKMRIK